MRQYTVLEVLGRGGFGKVVRARFDGPRGFTRQVAIKLLLPSSNTERNAEALRRLRDEARLLGLLQHRALVAVDRLAIIDGEWSVVMEYVAGVDGERLIGAGPMPARPAFEIIHEIADVLDHAWHVPGPEGHALRMLHRDIKPGNFLLTADGLVKVLDLGIARAEFAAREAVTEDVSFGTPTYMAPERLRGVEVHEGDVYSLGCVLFALLKGEPYGRAGLSMRPHTHHRNERMDELHAARPDVPVEALSLLAELLAFDPDERPTAGVLASQCLTLAESLPAPSLRAFARETVPRLRSEQRAKPSAEIGSVLREELEGAMEVSSGSVVQPPAETAASRGAVGVASAESAELPAAAPRPATRQGPPPQIVKLELDETAPLPGQVLAQVEEPRARPRGAVIAGAFGVISLAAAAWVGVSWMSDPSEPAHASSQAADVVSAPAGDEASLMEDEPLQPRAEEAVEPEAATTRQIGSVMTSPRRADPPTLSSSTTSAARVGATPNVLVRGAVPVALDVQGREIAVPGAITPGKYLILATFEEKPEPAGNVTVPATGRVTISCDLRTRMCASATDP